MNLTMLRTRSVVTVLLSAGTIATLAGAAHADHGGWRRYKGGYGQSYPVQRVIVREHSGAGPALAGLIGGFILGAAVTHAQPVYVHEQPVYVHEPVYVHDRSCSRDRVYDDLPAERYYDPYCDVWFDSLDDCEAHFHGHGHPRLVRVIDRDGDCIRTLHWCGRSWETWDGDRDDDR